MLLRCFLPSFHACLLLRVDSRLLAAVPSLGGSGSSFLLVCPPLSVASSAYHLYGKHIYIMPLCIVLSVVWLAVVTPCIQSAPLRFFAHLFQRLLSKHPTPTGGRDKKKEREAPSFPHTQHTPSTSSCDSPPNPPIPHFPSVLRPHLHHHPQLPVLEVGRVAAHDLVPVDHVLC